MIETNTGQRRLAVTGEFNFIIAQIKTSAEKMEVEATSIGLGSVEYFKEKFIVSKKIETA